MVLVGHGVGSFISCVYSILDTVAFMIVSWILGRVLSGTFHRSEYHIIHIIHVEICHPASSPASCVWKAYLVLEFVGNSELTPKWNPLFGIDFDIPFFVSTIHKPRSTWPTTLANNNACVAILLFAVHVRSHLSRTPSNDVMLLIPWYNHLPCTNRNRNRIHEKSISGLTHIIYGGWCDQRTLLHADSVYISRL